MSFGSVFSVNSCAVLEWVVCLDWLYEEWDNRLVKLNDGADVDD